MKKTKTTTSPHQSQQDASTPFFKKGGTGTFFSGTDHISKKEKPFFSPQTIQPKLTIGQPNDKYEKEADTVADQVVKHINTNTDTTPAVTNTIQPKTSESEEEIQAKEEEISNSETDIQRKPIFESAEDPNDATVQTKLNPNGIIMRASDNAVDNTVSSNIENGLSSSGSGQPLPGDTRSQMESGIGADFGNVRIHDDSQAASMNNELGAQAFTHGSNIYFNEGKYDTKSTDGQKLLAHELTHTVQQGGSTPSDIQEKPLSIHRKEDKPLPVEAPTTALDITHRFLPTGAWKTYLDSQKKGKRIDVLVKIGNEYEGIIKVRRIKEPTETQPGFYQIDKVGKRSFLEAKGLPSLNFMRDAGIKPGLVLKRFGENRQTTGFFSVQAKGITIGDVNSTVKAFNKNMDELGFLGLDQFKLKGIHVENEYANGGLTFTVSELKTIVDGFLEAGAGFGISGGQFTLDVNTIVSVRGVAEGEFNLRRLPSGQLEGRAELSANVANVESVLVVEYVNGAVSIEGTGTVESEKFSGSVSFIVTDEKQANETMRTELGVVQTEGESKDPKKKKARPKTMRNQVLVGWGTVTARITDWLEGTAKVGIDSKGQFTIVGEISVPDDVVLMEQQGKKQTLVDTKIKAGYGVPYVAQAYLFAGIELFVNAGFGPLVLKDVAFTGVYSTDPSILQTFSITGTLNINAFAILGLTASAGVGISLLGHDVEAGLDVTAAAGLRAYADANAVLEYVEKSTPQGGKVGEAWLKGHFEAAAQLFLMLAGEFFIELDSPWWSPAPDKRWPYPLGSVEYPIGDSMGIGADMKYLIGSTDYPEIKFTPVEFNPEKFTADVMADPPPGKGKGGEKKEPGKWTGEPGSGELKEGASAKKDGKGLEPKKKVDFAKLPEQERFMKALGEVGELGEQAKKVPMTKATLKAKLKKIRKKYAIDKIKIKGEGKDAKVLVKLKDHTNKKNKIKIPLISKKEQKKLLKKAKADLNTRLDNAAGKEKTLTKTQAKTIAKEWQTAHPLIEKVKVKDGGESWDFKVKVGGESEFIKGKRKSVNPESDDLFDKDKTDADFKVENSDETHKVYVDEIKGKPTVIIESTPTPIELFLDEYEMKNKGKLTKFNLEKIKESRKYINEKIKPLIQKIEGTDKTDTKTLDGLFGKLARENMFLSYFLKQALRKEIDINSLKEKYALEGIVGRYNAIPQITGDNLEGDHQPQNSLFSWIVTNLPYFANEKEGHQMRSRAKTRSNLGFAINLHHIRHVAGRTYGTKAVTVLKQFEIVVQKATANLKTSQEKRNVVVDLLRKELEKDVNAILAVYSKPLSHDNWKDINTLNVPDKEKMEIRDKIKSAVVTGEKQMMQQPFNNLKK